MARSVFKYDDSKDTVQQPIRWFAAKQQVTMLAPVKAMKAEDAIITQREKS